MEQGAVRAPHEHTETQVLTRSCCGDCERPEEAPGAGNQEPRSPPRPAVPYCDLSSCPPASEPPAGAPTSGYQAPAGLGLCSGPERDPLAECPSTSGSRNWDPEAVPYLEGLAPAPGSSVEEDSEPTTSTSSDSGDSGDAPNGTSNSLSADGSTAERREETCSCEHLAAMIPRKPREGPRVESARAGPVLTRSPVGEDALGQRKEDPGGRCLSAGQRWAKLRGESGQFLDRHQPALSPAARTDAPGGPRSGSTQTTCYRGSVHRDTVPAASTPPEARPTPWDKARALVTAQEHPRAPSTQPSSLGAPSSSRVTQRDSAGTSSAQRRDPQASSPTRAPQQEHPRASSQQENQPAPFPHQRDRHRTTCSQQDQPGASSPNRTPQRANSKTFCAQRDHPGASSPNRTPQKENSRTFSAQQDHPRASSPNRTPQWDHPRASSPNRIPQRDHPRASSPNRTPQRDHPRASSPNRTPQRDHPRASSPNRTPQRDHPRASSPNRIPQRDHPRASSPNRTPQRDHPRASSPNRTPQRDHLRASSPNRAPQKENSRTFSAQRDHPRASSPNRTPQRDHPRACAPQNNPRNSPTPRDSPKSSCGQWNNGRTSSTRRDPLQASSLRRNNPEASAPQCCTSRGNPGPGSPRRGAQLSAPRNHFPHRTNKDIPWASFPLRPTQGDGPRSGSPARSKQSEVPWASIALRPTQGDRPPTASPTRLGQAAPGPSQHQSAARGTASAQDPPGASRTTSPLHPAPRGASQTSMEPLTPCAVCIGHRDAPRATSPPRYLQHDPFPFFPDPRASEREGPHHEPPYVPPAVCIGHRDAPRASSPPRHAQFDPFPFLPDTSDSESPTPQHDPPQFPPFACIGYRDAPRASSPPRQAPEPALLFQDLPRASTESLAPSTDSLQEPPHTPGPVCIGHRDAPCFSAPPRQAPEPTLCFQDPPGASLESLVPSTDSLRGSPVLHPQVCIGHRDAPRASSPPRHPPSDLALLVTSSPPGSSGGSRGSAPPGETRHNLEREEYSVLADLPPPRRRVQREPPGGRGGRTPSPGRAEVERLFGQERRKSEAPGAFQAREEGPSRQLGPGQKQLLRRQSSPGLGREVSSACQVTLQTEPAHTSRTDPRTPERRPPDTSPPPRTSARTPERERRAEKLPERDRAVPRQPVGGWLGPELPPGCQDAHRSLARSWASQEEGEDAGPGVRRGPRAPEAAEWARESGGSPACHRGHSAAWEETPLNGPREPPHRTAQRGWDSPQEPRRPPHSTSVGPAELLKSRLPETSADGGAGGTRLRQPGTPEKRAEFDWRDLVGLLGAHVWEPAGTPSLPRLCWDRLLELLQAPLPRRDAGPTRDPPGPEPPSQPVGGAQAPLVNGHSPDQGPQSAGPAPSSACAPTQWPNTEESTSGQETSVLAEPEEAPRSSAGESSWPEEKLHSEEPEESEPHRGPDAPEQKQAESPDLLNFKKGWMSILDEPGEWKKHWFVLTDSSLKYYRDSTAEEADELDGEIDLRACTDVTEYAVQRNYGFRIHTKDAIYTLSAMTSGIRRNWIEALRKTVRPATAPDVTKLSDSNKENTLLGYGSPKGSLRAGEQRGGSTRKVDGQRPAADYVELSPLSQGSPQRARTSTRALDRPAKQEELERDLTQRSEERRKWFEAPDSGRTPEPATGETPRRGLGAPLTEDQQSRLSEEIEKKWQELEKLPLRDSRRVPLSALLSQSRAGRRGASHSHEALEREVQSLRAQLEAWQLRGETPSAQDDARPPPGYISQEACERSLAEMEASHQRLMEELQRHHERELQRLQEERDQLLAEETAATASAIEAVKKAYKEELSRELSKTRGVQQGPDGLRKQHQSDVEALRRELQVLSEQYSQKCLEIGALTRQAEEREHTLRCCQQEGQELLRHNQDLHARLSEEIERLRSFIASQGTGNGCGRSGEQRSTCELEVLLRVKENELQYLKREVQSLRDELQALQKDKRFTSGQYQDVYVELNHIKTRSEREIEQLKEHLRLAMAALQERAPPRNSLAD